MLGYFKRKLRTFIDANQFCPTAAVVLVNPFWLSRRALSRHLALYAPRLEGKILDFGCGTQPYRRLLRDAAQYVGLEYDCPENRRWKSAALFYDGQTIPLQDASMDGVLSTQTLEHVPNPERIVAEWARVLRPDGLLLCTAPLMWPEHEMPYDFQRYTTKGLAGLLEKRGFEIVAQERLLSDCRAPAQLFLAWLYDSLRYGARRPLVQLLLSALLFAPVSLLATLLAKVMPATPNTYLDNLVLARRRAP